MLGLGGPAADQPLHFPTIVEPPRAEGLGGSGMVASFVKAQQRAVPQSFRNGVSVFVEPDVVGEADKRIELPLRRWRSAEEAGHAILELGKVGAEARVGLCLRPGHAFGDAGPCRAPADRPRVPVLTAGIRIGAEETGLELVHQSDAGGADPTTKTLRRARGGLGCLGEAQGLVDRPVE